MKSPLFFGNSGSALITGMIAALSVGVVSALIMQQSQVTAKQTRAPRVKAAMVQVETKVRSLAFEPSAYETCPPGSPASCQVTLKTNLFENLREEIPGASCPGNGFCGVDITSPVFNPATGTLTAEIVYTGQEMSMAPIRVSAVVPNIIWQSEGLVSCPAHAPIFMGVDGNGDPVCGTLPSQCGNGRFLQSLDPMRLTTTGAAVCDDFPGTASCTSTQFISSVQWQNYSNTMSINCTERKSPFLVAAMGEDPTVYHYADNSYVVPPYPTTTTTMPTPTSSTTTTMPPTTTTTLPPSLAGLLCSFTSYGDSWQVNGHTCTGNRSLFGLISVPVGDSIPVIDISWGYSVSPPKGSARFYCDPAKVAAVIAEGDTGGWCSTAPDKNACYMLFYGHPNRVITTIPETCNP